MPPVLRAPNLIWHPGLARDARPLKSEGALTGSPFTTRGAALQAATAARKNDAVTFLIEHGPEGFTVHRYGENARTHVDGHEVRLEGAQTAETWLLDATGELHRLANSRFVKSTERDFFQPASVTNGRKLPSVPAEKQVNHGRNVTWNPRFAFRPGRDIEQLVDVMKWVQNTLPPDVKVKAVGARHAWSPAAATDGVLIHPEGMEFTENVEGHPELLRVGSGTRIRDLNQTLWQRGQSLPVLGGFDGQTVGGVLPTGTHGSVLSRGSLAEELVRSIDLVTPGGEKVRLEPSNGITDAANFAKSNPGWKLIKNDDAFNAGLINVGTFGVVHSYVLAPVPLPHEGSAHAHFRCRSRTHSARRQPHQADADRRRGSADREVPRSPRPRVPPGTSVEPAQRQAGGHLAAAAA
ncbi:MAG: FAD-binding protein [Archangium sp.]